MLSHGSAAERTEARRRRVVVYACSGSSNVAQLANAIAVRLDRAGLAEMSCIAGVGGGVKPLVHRAKTAPHVVLIDGCPLRCCETALANHGVEPDRIIRLHERGLRKRQGVDFPPAETDRVFREVLDEVAPLLLAVDPDVRDAVERELTEPINPGRDSA